MPRLPRRRTRRRSRLRRLADILGVISLFAGVTMVVAVLDELSMQEAAGPARVVDGDTLSLDGQRIRLVGIDAPERDQQCHRDGVAYDCGREARLRLAELIRDGEIVCRGNEKDRYGRLLMRCASGDTDLNSAMVLSGWAIAYGDYEKEERTARNEAAGMWAGDFDRPSEWRAQRGSIADIGPAGLAARLVQRLRSFVGFEEEKARP